MTIDLTDTPAEAAFRAAAREWLRSHVPGTLPSGDTRDGFARHVAWERELFAARWAVVSWPAAYGGRDATLWEWLVFEEEYYAAGAPQRVTQNGIFLLAPTLFEFGTDEQRDLLLPRMAAAEDLWCQGWSEPGAGSDLASITSRAERVDGGWRLTGQKTWTTRGAFCTHLFGLFRTDPSSERHRGLTYLLVPLDTPGVTVRGFGRLDGDEGFAEVFFDDAFLPDDAVPGGVVLGGVGEGWRVAMATTGSERGLTLRSPGRFLAASDRLVDLASRARARAGPRLRERVVRAWLGARAYQLFTAREVDGMLAGRSPGARSSLTKLHWSELDVALHETALELLGPDAERDDDVWTRGFQFSLSGPIYAGTNEIQRNIVAERLLGAAEEPVMRFALTEDQVSLRDAVREVLADTCPPAVVRSAWTGGRVDRVAAALTELGVPGMAVPEKDGGLGLSDVDLVPVLIELGYAAVPLPVAETAAVAAPLFAAAGRTGPDINDARSSVGFGARTAPDRASYMQRPPGWVALRRSDGPVPFAGRASAVLDLTGPTAVLRPADGTDVSTVDGSRAARLLDDAPGDLVTDDPELVALARDRADLATAAQLLGLGRRMLDLTVGHVTTRTQFGVPVGSFQAVKHHLADALLHLEFAEPLVYAAAWAVTTGSGTRERDVSAAVVPAVEAARFVVRRAIQCHGAIGYTVEYDLHLYAKRAWALAATCDLDAHLTRLARALNLEVP